MRSLFARVLSRRGLAVVSAVLLSLAPALSSKVLAAPMAVHHLSQNTLTKQQSSTGLALNLSSSQASIALTSGLFHGAQSVSINVGGTQTAFNAGSLVTPAEYVAIEEAFSSSSQTLSLNSQGQATGGTFFLSSLGTNHLSSLTVPQGVTAVDLSGSKPLYVSGLLSDSGFLVGSLVSGTSGHVITIDAGDLSVAAGGSISTIVPLSLSGVVQSSTHAVDLTIASLANVANAGSITASGVLSLSAAGTITNSLPAGVSAQAPTISGALGTNLYAGSGQFVNAGIVQAQSGNVSFNAANGAALNLNNAGGLVSANSGSINFRASGYSLSQPTNVIGGTFKSQSMNVYGGSGNVNVNADEISGVVNVTAGSAHVAASGGTLNMGTMNVSGDPTIVNSDGNVNLTASLSFPATDLAILAQGSITAASTCKSISLIGSSATGGNLTIVAGYNITPDSGGQQTDTSGIPYVVGTPSTSGGNVVLPGITIFTNSTGASGLSGGNVTVVAHGGPPDTGNVTLGAINTGSSQGQGGGIFIVAPGAIQTSSTINTQGLTGGGSINIQGAMPSVTNTPTYVNGTLTPGSGSFGVGAASSGSTIILGDLNMGNGTVITSGTSANAQAGNITLKADAMVAVTNSITANGPAGGGTVDIETANGFEQIFGTISTTSTKAAGGNVTLVGNEHGTFGEGQGIDVQNSIITSGNTNGGTVTCTSTDGQINVGFNILSQSVPVLISNNGGIQTNPTTATTGTAGDVTLTATSTNGNVLVARTINLTGVGGGGTLNITAGGDVRIDGGVNSSSTKNSGGDVSISGGGVSNTGIEIHGLLNTTGLTGSGNVTLSGGKGGVLVTGTINTSASQAIAGDLQVTADQDIRLNSTLNQSGAEGGSFTAESTNGFVSITSAINTAGSQSTGGDVTVSGENGIAITGAVTATGFSQGGTVLMNSGDTYLTIGGAVNTSGLSAKTGTTNSGGNAGNITLDKNSGSYVKVVGSVIADGGAGLSTGTGGNAGNILITTIVNTFGTDPVAARIGGVYIQGYVDARGGNTTGAVQAGNGGTVDIEAGTIQITGVVQTASINTSGGTAGAGGTAGTSRAITVDTFGVQPVPANFNLSGGGASVPALPGALFQIGGASVNGTAGTLVSGPNIAAKQNIIGTLAGVTNVTLSTNTSVAPSSQTININGTPTTINVLTIPATLTSPRKMVTPAVALALMQVSLDSSGNAQTIGLTKQGQASNLSVQGTNNVVSIPGYMFGQPLTAFNIANVSPTTPAPPAVAPGAITVDVILTNADPTVHITMGAITAATTAAGTPGTTTTAPSTVLTIGGTLDFVDAGTNAVQKVARFDLQISPLLVTGQILGSNNVNLNLTTSGSTQITDSGVIQSGNISITAPQGQISLAMGNGAVLEGPTSGGAGQLTLLDGLGTQPVGNIVLWTVAPKGKIPTTSFVDNLSVNLEGATVTVGSIKKTSTAVTLNAPTFDANAGIGQVLSTKQATIVTPGSLNVAGTGFSGSGSNLVIETTGTLTVNNAQLASMTNLLLVSVQGKVAFAGNNSIIAPINLTVESLNQTVTATGGSQSSFSASGGPVNIIGESGINMGGTNTIYGGTAVNILAPTGNIAIQANASSGIATSLSAYAFGPTNPIPSGYIRTAAPIIINCPGSISIGDDSSLTSLGANVSIVSYASSISLGDQSVFWAQGGNVSILAGGANASILGGSATASAPGNTFIAQQKTGFPSTGGIELLAGTSTSTIVQALGTRVNPPLISTISGVTYNPLTITIGITVTPTTKGRIIVGTVGSGNVYLLNTQGNTVVNSMNGAVVVEGLLPGASVTLDSAQFTSIAPTAYHQDGAFSDGVVDTGDVDDDDAVGVAETFPTNR